MVPHLSWRVVPKTGQSTSVQVLSALSRGKALHVSCTVSVQCLSFTHWCDVICSHLPCDPLELNLGVIWKYNLRASWDHSGDAEGRISMAELVCVLTEQMKGEIWIPVARWVLQTEIEKDHDVVCKNIRLEKRCNDHRAPSCCICRITFHVKTVI